MDGCCSPNLSAGNIKTPMDSFYDLSLLRKYFNINPAKQKFCSLQKEKERNKKITGNPRQS